MQTAKLLIILFIFAPISVFGESMKLDKPLYKVAITTEGIDYGVIINGFEVLTGNGESVSVEVPINQFVQTGENKFELKLNTWEENDELYLSPNAMIKVEYRLYTQESSHVVLSKLVFSAENHKNNKAFDGASSKGIYSLRNNALVEDSSGDYKRADPSHFVDVNDYDANYISQIVKMPTPFPLWRFIKSEKMRAQNSFETIEEMDSFVKPIFHILEGIHSDLQKGSAQTFLSLTKERNEEMDLAYYLEKGTYEKRLKESLEKKFKDHIALDPLDFDEAQPMISPGQNVIQLGTAPLISFSAKDESSFYSFPIYFRKEGDNWVITR